MEVHAVHIRGDKTAASVSVSESRTIFRARKKNKFAMCSHAPAGTTIEALAVSIFAIAQLWLRAPLEASWLFSRCPSADTAAPQRMHAASGPARPGRRLLAAPQPAASGDRGGCRHCRSLLSALPMSLGANNNAQKEAKKPRKNEEEETTDAGGASPAAAAVVVAVVLRCFPPGAAAATAVAADVKKLAR